MVMSICKLRPVLDIAPLQAMVDVIHPFPSFVHVYGNPQPEKNNGAWMMYGDKNRTPDTKDKIEFLRGYETVAPAEFDHICHYFNDDLKLTRVKPEHINLLRTRGFINRHVDEARFCSVNIGLRGAASALTSFDSAALHCEDGRAYLLDVTKPHWVTGPAEYRYLISLSIVSYSYEQVVEHFNQFGLIDNA